MAGPRTLVFVSDASVHSQLEQLVASLPWAPARELGFLPLQGDVQQAIAEQRERHGGLPIGAVVGDESDVLAALNGGADEAAVFTNVDAKSLGVFVDRIELRARLRAEGQRMQESFAHAEKLTALGTLVAGVGHEINNPLSAMLLSIEAARRYLLPALDLTWELGRAARSGDPLPLGLLSRLSTAQERVPRDATRIFDDIGAAADAIASIVRDLRVFARTDREEPLELVGVDELVDHALRLVGRELFAHALLERDYQHDLPKLVVPRNRVTQVIINVLINAAHAMREVQRPAHRVRISARADDEFVALAISDTGPGIPPESIDRIFDPFFTTKRQELGTGLGLAISRSILRRMGGDLAVESVYGDGATFLCFMPIPSNERVRSAYQRSITPPRGLPRATASVLVVDDDERMLRSYVRLLNPTHRLLVAQDANDAVDLLESGSEPDIVLLELDLPGMDGRKFLNWLAERRPKLRRHTLLVTSAGDQSQYGPFLRAYTGPVLHKPVHGVDLIAAINRVLASDTQQVPKRSDDTV